MANKPIPFEIHKARHTARRDRHGTAAEQPKVSLAPPKCPSRILGPEGRKFWRRIMAVAGSIPKEPDEAVLSMACALWEDFVASRKGGSEFTAAQFTQLRLCLVELGLTPSARARLRGD